MEKIGTRTYQSCCAGGDENPLNEGIQGWKSVPPWHKLLFVSPYEYAKVG